MNKVISLDSLKRLVIAPLKRLIDKKIDKIDGKGLSTNDFTNEEKEKLANVEVGAQVNVQPDWNQVNDTQDDFIKNKPELFSGSWNDLTDKPFGEALVQGLKALHVNQASVANYSELVDGIYYYKNLATVDFKTFSSKRSFAAVFYNLNNTGEDQINAQLGVDTDTIDFYFSGYEKVSVTIEENGSLTLAMKPDVSTSHTKNIVVSFAEFVTAFTTINPEYITSYEVLEEDNGKVLGIVDGEIALVEPESELPEGAGAHKQLVTDYNGNLVWEDKLAIDTSRARYVLAEGQTYDFYGHPGIYESVHYNKMPVAGDVIVATFEGTELRHEVKEGETSFVFYNEEKTMTVTLDKVAVIFRDLTDKGGYVKIEHEYIADPVTIDPKFLPDGIGYKTKEIVSVSWDGVIEGKTSYTIDEYIYYKVSSVVLSNELIKNGRVAFSSGASFTFNDIWSTMIDSGYITDDYAYGEVFVCTRKENVEVMGTVFPEPGLYFYYSDHAFAMNFGSSLESTRAIPAEYITGSEVTETDNGKIMGVESGKLALMDVDTVISSAQSFQDLKQLKEPQFSMKLIDQVSYQVYSLCVRDGNLVTYCSTTDIIKVKSMPTKTTYIAGDFLDTDGLVVSFVDKDGVEKEIIDYTVSHEVLDENVKFITLTYIENSTKYTTYVPVTVEPFDASVVLVDFDYVANEDGTYTIIDWKGTLNGEASTEIIIPNNALIIV